MASRTILPVAVVLVAMAAIISQGTPAPGESESPAVSLLRAIAVRLEVGNIKTGQHVCCCQGFVYDVSGSTAYVVSAKHCAEHFATHDLNGEEDYRGVYINVLYPNHARGRMLHGWALRQSDVMVVTANFTRPPDAWRTLCPTCRFYNSFGENRRITVISTLVAGFGQPVISGGVVTSNANGRYFVDLSASPGTSGSVVLDLRGNVVGIVVAHYPSAPGVQAGSRAVIVTAPVVEYALKRAVSALQR